MKNYSHPAEVIERVRGKSGELQLQRRGREFEFIFNGIFLMASYNGASEREMVKAALNVCSESGEHSCSPLRVLIAGLGMGLGLHEALLFPGVMRVDLVELEEAVVRWNRGPLSEINGGALRDFRVKIIQDDIVAYLKNTNKALPGRDCFYHAIILDTDNGPGWLSRHENAFLYSFQGSLLLRDLLYPGGALSVWSASPAPEYSSLLKMIFREVQEKELWEKTGQSSYYYLAKK